MDSEEETDVIVADGESYRVRCQGCGSDADDGDPFRMWVACDNCDVWHHARCVGRWSDSQCDQPFSCDGCKQAEVQSHRRETKSKNAGRPCTPRCQPPGCAGGRGCDKGMGLLTETQRRKIEDLVFAVERGNAAFLDAALCPGEQVVYDAPPPASPVEAVVVEYGSKGALVHFSRGSAEFTAWTPPAYVIRFGLRFTDSELDAYAVRCGCTQFTPHRKQLKFEMRRIRESYGLPLPDTPAIFLKKRRRAACVSLAVSPPIPVVGLGTPTFEVEQDHGEEPEMEGLETGGTAGVLAVVPAEPAAMGVEGFLVATAAEGEAPPLLP